MKSPSRLAVSFVALSTVLAVASVAPAASTQGSDARQAQRRRNRRRGRHHNTTATPPDTTSTTTTDDTATTPLEGANEAPPPANTTTTTTTTTETTTSEAPSTHPTRPVALDLNVAFRGLGRSLWFNNDVNSAFRGYDLAFGPSIYAAVEWFPGAHFTSGLLANIGLYGDFGYAFAISSQDSAGNRFDTSSLLYDIGVRGRIPLGHLDLAIRIGYGGQSFAISDSGSATSRVPAVNYQFVRVGLGLRYDIAERIGILFGANYLLVVDDGAYRLNFPHEGVHGLDGNVGIAVRLVAGLEVRVGFDFRAYLHDHNVQSGDPYMVSSATDLIWGTDLGLAYRF